MIQVHVYVSISGLSFSPAAAIEEHGIFYDSQNEPGEIGTTGRYKNVPIPEGRARVVLTKDTSKCFDSEQVWGPLVGIVDACRRHGASDITVFLDVGYVDQCNFELAPYVVHLIGSLGLTVAISCYEMRAAT